MLEKLIYNYLIKFAAWPLCLLCRSVCVLADIDNLALICFPDVMEHKKAKHPIEQGNQQDNHRDYFLF